MTTVSSPPKKVNLQVTKWAPAVAVQGFVETVLVMPTGMGPGWFVYTQMPSNVLPSNLTSKRNDSEPGQFELSWVTMTLNVARSPTLGEGGDRLGFDKAQSMVYCVGEPGRVVNDFHTPA